jgi:hypothetical protein
MKMVLAGNHIGFTKKKWKHGYTVYIYYIIIYYIFEVGFL